jgi:predicted HicB family RNase H-like nuclease
MTTATLDAPMAKKKPETTMTRIDAAIVEEAKWVAAYQRKSLVAYISEALRAAVERDQKAIRRKMAEPRPE